LVAQVHGKWLGPDDAGSFLWEELSKICLRWDGRQGLLSAPENDDLRQDFIGTLKSALESLPRQYSIHIELPRFPDLGAFSIPINDTVELVGVPHDFNDQKNALARALMAPTTDRSVCLKVQSSGYASSFDGSSAVADGLSLAKQSAFFLMAGTALAPLGRFRDVYARATITQVGYPTEKITLPDGIARFFGGLDLSDDLEVPDDEGASSSASLLTAPNKKAVTPNEKIRAIKIRLARADAFFSHRGHPDFAAICAAIEWYFDAISTSNETLAYLAACIGLEAVLGYGESTQERMDAMTQRLGDRYGFLVGRSRGEREKLAEQYRAVLRARGELVHARKKRLAEQERHHLTQAKSMLWSLIWREIRTLSAGPDRAL
jgi:hypothetical protein